MMVITCTALSKRLAAAHRRGDAQGMVMRKTGIKDQTLSMMVFFIGTPIICLTGIL